MINWITRKFDELTLEELYSILELRNEVFIVEQNCVYNDTDGKDQSAWHLMAIEGDKLIAYTRILPPGISYSDPAIGRVVTAPSTRRSGLGKELMKRSIEACEKLFGKTSITLNAQVYLQSFYESLGFIVVGEEYLDDEIPHIRMSRKHSW
ncbi:MAG TPA: GNAT family N-acetyltransferase [Chitinophagaceae bacterium]|jgi:ElaA protein|nr:GNAT family N-acetyltransferase [Chitinophagaceae bacterium]